ALLALVRLPAAGSRQEAHSAWLPHPRGSRAPAPAEPEHLDLPAGPEPALCGLNLLFRNRFPPRDRRPLEPGPAGAGELCILTQSGPPDQIHRIGGPPLPPPLPWAWRRDWKVRLVRERRRRLPQPERGGERGGWRAPTFSGLYRLSFCFYQSLKTSNPRSACPS